LQANGQSILCEADWNASGWLTAEVEGVG